jgi:hypothetical protein
MAVMTRRLFLGSALSILLCSGLAAGERWPAEKANSWYQQMPWLVGCNFGPSTAINQLEMWQAETFDRATIDRELGFAEKIGFNSMRVFLHDLLWDQDAQGFLARLDEFLTLADKHHIGVMFVLLDGVWDPHPALGKQREPKPHVHNSGWVQSPGLNALKNPRRHARLEAYAKGVMSRFKNDKRVHAWDLFNEPENPNTSAYGKIEAENKAELAHVLLKKVYAWAREVDPAQPLTMGVWLGNWSDPDKLTPVEKFMLENSDLISFHNYGPLDDMKKCVASLRRYERPILCTEYMARPRGSTFDPILGYLKEQKIAAYNWGFVAGKTQTIYPWDTWRTNYTAEPKVWFHDIFHAAGTPFDPNEIAYIKRLTGNK